VSKRWTDRVPIFICTRSVCIWPRARGSMSVSAGVAMRVKQCVMDACPPGARDNIRFGDLSSRRDMVLLPVTGATLLDIGLLTGRLGRLGCKAYLRAGQGQELSRIDVYIPKPMPYDGTIRCLLASLSASVVGAVVAYVLGV
jgi:hypothetical protein